MLADQPRTTKYHSVILQNKESLKDKVILDVGCGTGIISLFCAHHARPKAVSVSASICAQLWAMVREVGSCPSVAETDILYWPQAV